MRAEEFCNLQLLRFKKQKLFKISNIQLEKQYFFLQWRQIYIDKNITSVNSTSIFLFSISRLAVSNNTNKLATIVLLDKHPILQKY